MSSRFQDLLARLVWGRLRRRKRPGRQRAPVSGIVAVETPTPAADSTDTAPPTTEPTPDLMEGVMEPATTPPYDLATAGERTWALAQTHEDRIRAYRSLELGKYLQELARSVAWKVWTLEERREAIEFVVVTCDPNETRFPFGIFDGYDTDWVESLRWKRPYCDLSAAYPGEEVQHVLDTLGLRIPPERIVCLWPYPRTLRGVAWSAPAAHDRGDPKVWEAPEPELPA